MKPTSYSTFFEMLTGHSPLPYQAELAQGDWPEVIDVATGLGKTQAVLGAWLFRLLQRDTRGGRRLVYCLPMRSLVDQTAGVAQVLTERAAAQFCERGLSAPVVQRMLGGFVDEAWEINPEAAAILVGTQDMLISRALSRGYAMSRYKWPVHFGLLHNDCTWVLDETQLMGVAVETSAQLEGLRHQLRTLGSVHTIWMSATIGRQQLATVDHPEPTGGWRTLSLGPADHDSDVVRTRIGARKPLRRAPVGPGEQPERYAAKLAQLAAGSHRDRGGLTLVVVNRVDRAQAVYRALRGLGVDPVGLIHSRFRTADRRVHEAVLFAEGARIVVATQAVEAGVDVSSRTLITELCPWPALVQRFGRCNRYGEHSDAAVFWVDTDVDGDEELALPYTPQELVEARTLLSGLDDVGLVRLARVPYVPLRVVRPVLRRRDLLDLFDTTPDLLGNDVDVSRFVRDGNDSDVRVFYREFEHDPDGEIPAPAREELVNVSLGRARAFVSRLATKRKSLGSEERERRYSRCFRAWSWNPLDRSPWTAISDATMFPGQVLLLHVHAGGYSAELGWTGDVRVGGAVVPLVDGLIPAAQERLDADPRTSIDRWIRLDEHLRDVSHEMEVLASALALGEPLASALVSAALWHDIGKSHPEFQSRLIDPVRHDPALQPTGEGPFAKSVHRRSGGSRAHFRHELASALAWLQSSSEHPQRDLIAYLIAAHHGKVRLSIRSVPGETRPNEHDRLFARGVWHGDQIPAVVLPDGTTVGPLELDLSPILMGEGSWVERMLSLRDDPELGPFRLSYLEALVRIADWRATRKERIHA